MSVGCVQCGQIGKKTFDNVVSIKEGTDTHTGGRADNLIYGRLVLQPAKQIGSNIV